jgi:hypothetical protein
VQTQCRGNFLLFLNDDFFLSTVTYLYETLDRKNQCIGAPAMGHWLASVPLGRLRQREQIKEDYLASTKAISVTPCYCNQY